MIHKNLASRHNVFPDAFFHEGLITFRKGCDNPLVLPDGFLILAGEGEGHDPEPFEMVVEVGDHLDQFPIAREFYENLVEPRMGPVESFKVFPAYEFRELRVDLFQLLDVLFSDTVAGEARCQSLQGAFYLIKVIDLFGVDPGDDGAFTGNDLDKALMLMPMEEARSPSEILSPGLNWPFMIAVLIDSAISRERSRGSSILILNSPIGTLQTGIPTNGTIRFRHFFAVEFLLYPAGSGPLFSGRGFAPSFSGVPPGKGGSVPLSILHLSVDVFSLSEAGERDLRWVARVYSIQYSTKS